MKPSREVTGLDYRQRVCRAMNYISGHLDRDLALEDIARAANFSAFHFHRIFKAATGETVFGFVRRLRLEWAANRLLANPRDDVTAVARKRHRDAAGIIRHEGAGVLDQVGQHGKRRGARDRGAEPDTDHVGTAGLDRADLVDRGGDVGVGDGLPVAAADAAVPSVDASSTTII